MFFLQAIPINNIDSHYHIQSIFTKQRNEANGLISNINKTRHALQLLGIY